MEDPIATLQQQCREQLQYLQNEQHGVQRLAQELTSQRDKLQEKLDTASQAEAHAKSLEAKALALLEDNRNKKLQLAQQEVAHAEAQKALDDKTQESIAQQQALDEREQRLQAFELKLAEHYKVLLALNDQLRNRIATAGQQQSADGAVGLEQQQLSDNQQPAVANDQSEPLQVAHWRWLCQQQIQNPDTLQRQLRLLSNEGANVEAVKETKDIGIQAFVPSGKARNPQEEAHHQKLKQEAQRKAAAKAQRRREHEERMRQQKEQKRQRQQSQSPGSRQYNNKSFKQSHQNGSMPFHERYGEYSEHAPHYTSDHLPNQTQQDMFDDGHNMDNCAYVMHGMQGMHEYQTPEGAGYNHVPTPLAQGLIPDNGWTAQRPPHAWGSRQENVPRFERAHAPFAEVGMVDKGTSRQGARFVSPASSSMHLGQPASHNQLPQVEQLEHSCPRIDLDDSRQMPEDKSAMGAQQQEDIKQGTVTEQQLVNQQATQAVETQQRDTNGNDDQQLEMNQQEQVAGKADMEQRPKQKRKKGQQQQQEVEQDSSRKRKRKSEKLRSGSPLPESKSPRIDASSQNNGDAQTSAAMVVNSPEPAVQRRDSKRRSKELEQATALDNREHKQTVDHTPDGEGYMIPSAHNQAADVQAGSLVEPNTAPPAPNPSYTETCLPQDPRQPSHAVPQPQLPPQPHSMPNPQDHDRYSLGTEPHDHASLQAPAHGFYPPHTSWDHHAGSDYPPQHYQQQPHQWHRSRPESSAYQSRWDEQGQSRWPVHSGWQQVHGNMQQYAWQGHAADHAMQPGNPPTPHQPYPPMYDRSKPPPHNGRHPAHPQHYSMYNNKPWQRQPGRGHASRDQDTRQDSMQQRARGPPTARPLQDTAPPTRQDSDMKHSEEHKPDQSNDAPASCDKQVSDAVQTSPAASHDQVQPPAGGAAGAHAAAKRKFAPTGDGKGRTLLPGKKQANKLLAQRKAQELMQDQSDTESLQRLVQQFRKEEQSAQQSI